MNDTMNSLCVAGQALLKRRKIPDVKRVYWVTSAGELCDGRGDEYCYIDRSDKPKVARVYNGIVDVIDGWPIDA